MYERDTCMNRIQKSQLIAFSCLLAASLACVGKKTTIPGGDDPAKADELLRCAAEPGRVVTISGSNLSDGIGSGRVNFNGATIVPDHVSNTEVDFTVPAGAVSGPVTYTCLNGTTAPLNLRVLTGDPVDEVEPNDITSGADAVQMLGELVANGTLSSTFDKDHYKFICLDTRRRIRIQVSPRVVSVLYLDGLSVPLDVDGVYSTTITKDDLLIGLTGGTGAYNLSIQHMP